MRAVRTLDTADSGEPSGDHPAEPLAGGELAGAQEPPRDLARGLAQPTVGDEAAFWSGLIRVRLRGEQAIARKVAVVTEEVVVRKTSTTERRWISAAPRRE
jgi:hypothetical protein